MARLVNQILSANGSTEPFDLSDAGVTCFIGNNLNNTFGTNGVIYVEYSDDSFASYTRDSETITAEDAKNLKPKGNGVQCRLTLAGASTTPSLSIKVFD